MGFVDGRNQHELEAVTSLGCPAVLTARAQPTANLAVVIGNADELYGLAHRHFADLDLAHVSQFVFGQSLRDSGVVARYRAWCRDHGIAFRSFATADATDLPQAIDSGFDPDVVNDIDPLVAAWIRNLPKPAGVFSQDFYASWFLCRYCQLLGISVPEELAIIGADPFDIATKSRPAATTFRMPGQRIGRRAGQVLASMIFGVRPPPEIVTVNGMELSIRGSTMRVSAVGAEIDKASRFIDTYACDGITVNDVVAQTQGVTRMTFHKRFVERTGSTPGEAIVERRLAEAKRLLTDTQISVGAIAGMCGYSDALYFYKAFRQREGVGPRDYRRLTQQRQVDT